MNTPRIPALRRQTRAGDAECLTELKSRIRSAQIKAALSVNRELILLYHRIGRDILTRQLEEGWGAKVIDRLSRDLRLEFTEIIKGFSPRNLKYMRAFAEAYPDDQFVQQVAAQIPWFHHCVILDKVSEKPIGVAAYRLTEKLPERLKGKLPTIKELESELGGERLPSERKK